MFRNVTPEKAIAFTHLCVLFTCCWPPPLGATRFRTLLFKYLRTMALINCIMLLLPILNAVYVYRSDPENLPKAAVMCIAATQVLTLTVCCSPQYDRFQLLIHEMKECCKKADEFEREVFQRYTNRYSTYYGLSACWFYLTWAVFCIGSLFLPNAFPTNAEYPFDVNYEPVRSLVYLQQMVALLQGSAHVSFNIFIALMLLFSAARFEIVIAEVRSITDVRSLIKCMQNYRAVHRFATEVSKSLRIVAMFKITFSFMACALSAISIVSKASFSVKVQCVSLLGVGLQETFMCAMPADRLMEISENVMRTAYESKWYQQPVSHQKSVLFMLLPQSPVVLSVACVMPALSLAYFCSFLSSVFSLYTALRLVLGDD